MAVISDKRANLAAARTLQLTIFRNPIGITLAGYKTELDPATVAGKLNPGGDPTLIQVAEWQDSNVVARWQEEYGEDISSCKIWTKISPGASAPVPLVVIDVPPWDVEDPEDDDHKVVVTDLTLERGYITHLFFAGASTPSGWSDESGTGGYFEDKFPVGAQNGLTANEDSNGPTASLVSCGNANTRGYATGPTGGATQQHTCHTLGTIAAAESSNIPQYKALKMIRSNKILASIPKDAVIIFDDTVPTGFTRYSAQDGYYVRGGGTVGASGGNATRNFAVSGTTSSCGSATATGDESEEPESSTSGSHSHQFSANSPSINNDPPYIEVILGQADNEISYIPEGAILMFDETPPSADWDVMDWGGKLLKGAATYGGTGGNTTETPANLTANTGTSAEDDLSDEGASSTVKRHYHQLVISFDAVSTYPACRQVIFAKAKHDITEDGESACVIQNDIGLVSDIVYYSLYSESGRHIAIRNKGEDQGELHCCFAADGGSGDNFVYHGKSTNGGKTWTVERIDATVDCEQVMSDLVVDKDNNIHFVWAEMDAGDSSHRQIKYRKLGANDVWGAVETVSTAGDPYYQADPCIQVKNDGETIGVTWVGYGWGDSAVGLDVAYRERTTTAWGSEERITTNGTATIYYRTPSVDFDSDDYPHIVANYGTQATWNAQNVLYWYKTVAGWQAAETVNNDAGDANLAPGNSNMLIDEDNYIHVAYTISDAGGPLDICYKKKARGGAWGTKEAVATHDASYEYSAPQIQLDGDGNVYCSYTVSDLTNERYAIAYKIRTTGWGSEQSVKTNVGRNFLYVQMLWSRQPLKSGIYQSWSQQSIILIYATGPRGYDDVANVVFYTEANTVIGDIPGDVTTTTYRTKRRGSLCRTKINGPKASPAKI